MVRRSDMISSFSIDADFYDSEEAGGNINLVLQNTSKYVQKVEPGERLIQGLIVQTIVDDTEPLSEERKGGVGSTGE